MSLLRAEQAGTKVRTVPFLPDLSMEAPRISAALLVVKHHGHRGPERLPYVSTGKFIELGAGQVAKRVKGGASQPRCGHAAARS